MTKRKIVAACVLAAGLALPAATQQLRAGNSQATANWAWALDMDANEALAFGAGSLLLCNAIPNPGSLACGAAGLL